MNNVQNKKKNEPLRCLGQQIKWSEGKKTGLSCMEAPDIT